MARGGKIVTDHDRYIGERIREARLAAKMSQEHLAHMLGTSYQQIQKYENGKNRVNGGRIGRLCVALNRPLEYFFPSAGDIRAMPFLSAFLATKEGLELAKICPQLAPADRALVLTTAKRLAVKEQTR